MEQVQALLQFGQPRGFQFHLTSVTGNRLLQFAQDFDRLGVQFSQIRRAGIHPLQLLQGAPHDAHPRHNRVLALREHLQRGLAELKQLRRVVGPVKFRLDQGLLAGLQGRGFDFLHLKAQQIQLLHIRLLLSAEGGHFGHQTGAAPDPFRNCFAIFF